MDFGEEYLLFLKWNSGGCTVENLVRTEELKGV
jgi:hypothetical protein